MYFFSGIGGAGTLPLAMILQARGEDIAWSDRGFDQGRTPEKFEWISAHWPTHYPQDGSGLHALQDKLTAVIPSGSVEDNVPDVVEAKKLGVPIIKRPALLASLFNSAKRRVAIAGTSGKTTTTGMTGFLLKEAGQDPTVMNGGIFRNYSGAHDYCSALTGQDGTFVIEADESDGSIALYTPDIAVLNNVTFDHKPMDELNRIFAAFLATAPQAVLNLDDPLVTELLKTYSGTALTYALDNKNARLVVEDITLRPDGSDSWLVDTQTGTRHRLSLSQPGRHNIANALAALATVSLLGVSLEKGTALLTGFRGIARRMEVVGQAKGITVIDDFAHNPDKISATLSALRAFPGRLIVMFQPHGFGPLRLMRKELVESFVTHLEAEDEVLMPEPFYAGGTVDRSVSSTHIIADLLQQGVHAKVFPDRASCLPRILATAKTGDRIVVMGARDDSLSDFAREIVSALS